MVTSTQPNPLRPAQPPVTTTLPIPKPNPPPLALPPPFKEGRLQLVKPFITYTARVEIGREIFCVSVDLPKEKGMNDVLWAAYVEAEIKPMLEALKVQNTLSDSFELDFSEVDQLIVKDSPTRENPQPISRLIQTKNFSPQLRSYFDDMHRLFYETKRVFATPAVKALLAKNKKSKCHSVHCPIPFIENEGNRCHTTVLWHMFMNNPHWREQFEESENSHNPAVRAFYHSYLEMGQKKSLPSAAPDRLFARFFDEVYRREFGIDPEGQQDISDIFRSFYEYLTPSLRAQGGGGPIVPLIEVGIPRAGISMQTLVNQNPFSQNFLTPPDTLFVNIQRGIEEDEEEDESRQGPAVNRTPIALDEELSLKGKTYELQSFAVRVGEGRRGHYVGYLKTRDEKGNIHYGRCDDQNRPSGYEPISREEFLRAGRGASFVCYGPSSDPLAGVPKLFE